MKSENNSNGSVFMRWFKRIGFWGFIFFLVKGMIWLVVGYLALK